MHPLYYTRLYLHYTTLHYTTLHYIILGEATVLLAKKLSLPAGPGVTDWFNVTLPSDATSEILTAVVTDDLGVVLSDNLIPLTAPAHMALGKASIKFSVGSAGGDGNVPIHVSSDEVAVYVTLTTLANGRFSDNAFLLLPAKPLDIFFLPFGPLDMEKLRSSLRVEDVSAYM